MPFFRPAPADPASRPALRDDALLSPEELADRQRKRRRLVTALLLLFAAVGIGFAAKPALHVAKAWQARRLAAEAERLIKRKRWVDAKAKVQDALQIWHLEPAAARAAARLLKRTGSLREAAKFWQQVETARPLTRDEHREYAQTLLANRDLPGAEHHLRLAWPKGEAGVPPDWQLGIQLALARNQRAEAADLARRLLASRTISPRQRLGAAMALASAGDKDACADAWDVILKISEDKASPESLAALSALAQTLGAAPNTDAPAIPSHTPPPMLSEVIERMEAHPLARIQHHLLATDLRIAQDPAHRAELIQSAANRFAGVKDDADLGTLTGWLYAKGEFERALEVLPIERAIDDPRLFWSRLDALGALGRWAEIRKALQSHKVAIDPMVEQMYLARCAEQLGEPKVRDARWNAALDAASGRPEKLAQLGAYALKSGNGAVSLRAFTAAVQAAPESREANEGLLGACEAAGDARKTRETLATILQRWPQDAAARNDAAYLDALLGDNLRGALATARQLVEAEPASLPHRVTLALAELRAGNNLAALDAFRALDISRAVLQPRQRAVFAAVFWATSYPREARETLRGLPLEQLLPEERALVQPILEAGTAP